MDKDATLTVTARLVAKMSLKQCPFLAKSHQSILSGLVFKRNQSDSEFNNFFSFKRKPSTKNPFFSPPHHGWDAPGVSGEAESG
jgi:hypothetical protein